MVMVLFVYIFVMFGKMSGNDDFTFVVSAVSMIMCAYMSGVVDVLYVLIKGVSVVNVFLVLIF